MKLSSSNYFSPEMQRAYMSVSQYKEFEKCPARALASIDEEFMQPKTTALLVGSYVDAYFEGSLDNFCAENPEIFRRDGELFAPYRQAEEIIARVQRDKLFMSYLSGRKQVIMTGEISGVKVKIKVDVLFDDKIVDFKCLKDFKPIFIEEKGKLPWYEAWRYDLQGAVYQEIVRQNTGKKLPFYLAAVTKEEVTDYDIWHIKDDLLAFELEQFSENAPYYELVKKGAFKPDRCGKCSYCKETKILTRIRESGDELYD